MFLVFGASRPLRNLMAVILMAPVCCTSGGGEESLRMSDLAAELERRSNSDKRRSADLQRRSAETGELNSNLARSIGELNVDVQRLYSEQAPLRLRP